MSGGWDGDVGGLESERESLLRAWDDLMPRIKCWVVGGGLIRSDGTSLDLERVC